MQQNGSRVWGGVEDIKKRREEKRKEGRERQVGGGMTHC